MSIEIHDGAAWIFGTRSCGTPPDTPIANMLGWIVEQLHFGHFVVERDQSGDGVSLTLGQAAAFARPLDPSRAPEHEEQRNRSLVLARIFALARERGVEPEYKDLAERADAAARNSQAGRMNTDLYYAFALVNVLNRIAGATFVFEAPAILGRADKDIVEMLGEATRCLLFGLFRSSASVCRSCMEAALESVVDKTELRLEMAPKGPSRRSPGKIESLINIAIRRELLAEDLKGAADFVRRRGNDAIHGDPLSEKLAWEILDRTRQIVARIFDQAA